MGINAFFTYTIWLGAVPYRVDVNDGVTDAVAEAQGQRRRAA